MYAVYRNEFGGYCCGLRRVGGLRVDVIGTAKCVRVTRGTRCVFRLRDDGRCTQSSVSSVIFVEVISRAGRETLETMLHVVADVVGDPRSDAMDALSEVFGPCLNG